MIAKMTKDFKKYKRMMQGFAVIGLLFIGGSFLQESDTIKGLMAGLGTSFTLIGSLNLLILMFKSKRNKDYAEEMDLQMSDERLVKNKLKGLAYSGVIGMMALALSNVVHLIWDVNSLLLNNVVVFMYVISIGCYKLYYKNK